MSDWEEASLADLADYINGRAIKPEECSSSDGIPVIRIKQINDPESIEDRFCGEGLDERNIARHGDLLFSWSATLKTILWQGPTGAINQHIFKVLPKEGIDKTFLHYLIDHAIPALAEESHGSTMKHIKKSALSAFRLPIPPLPEQKKIAEILSGVDKQIANKTRKIEKHEHLIAGILNQLMTSGTTNQKLVETDAGRVPENWRVGRVEDFFDLGRGRVISIPHIKENPGPYPVFSSQSKNNGEMGRMNSYDFEGDYFTWTTDGAYAGSVFARSGKFNCTNVCGTGRAKSSSDADTRFAAYFLQRVAKRHVSYVGNPKLMNNVFAAIPFALPPIGEQREIAKIIDATKSGTELLGRQITSLSNLKSSIASDLLSGRKRVSV